jgi:hypothetical protein
VFGLHEKITKSENAITANVQSPLSDSSKHVWPDPTKMTGFLPNSFGSGQIRLDPDHFDQIQPASDHGRILASFG